MQKHQSCLLIKFVTWCLVFAALLLYIEIRWIPCTVHISLCSWPLKSLTNTYECRWYNQTAYCKYALAPLLQLQHQIYIINIGKGLDMRINKRNHISNSPWWSQWGQISSLKDKNTINAVAYIGKYTIEWLTYLMAGCLA